MNKFTKLLCIAAAVAAMSAMASCGNRDNSTSDSPNTSVSTPNESSGSPSTGEKSDLEVEISDLDEDTVTAEFDGEAKAVSYKASGNTTLKVEYEGADGTAYAKSETAPTNAGKYTVTLSFAGDGTYNAYSKTVTLVVEKAQNVLRVEVADVLEGGELKPTVVENKAGDVTYRYKGRGDTTYEESDTAPTEIGTYTLIATAASGQNYYGSRIEVEFSVISSDPLYGLEASVTDEVKNKERLSDMHLAKKSYLTNGGQGSDGKPVGSAREALNGVVTSKDTHLMLLSDQLTADSYTVVIKSNKTFLAYFHFAIEGGDSYETVMVEPDEYRAKEAMDIRIPEGTHAITFSLRDGKQAGKPIKGVYIDLYNAIEGSELTVYGFYKTKEVTDAEVPKDLKDQLADKFALDYEAPTDGGWETNKRLQKFGDKIIVCEKENLALLSDNMPETIYLLVKADKANMAYFRFGVDEQYTYETVVNNPARYCKFKNDVQIAEGYQILKITMVANPDYTGGANKPVTGVHILLDKSVTLTLFGVWADKAVEKEQLAVTVTGETEGTVNATYTGEAIPVAYTATAETVLKVEYEGTDGTTYDKSETAPTNAGKYTVKLSFAGNKVYEAFEKTVTLVIAKAQNNLAVTVENIREGETVAPQVRSNSAGAVTYRYKGRADTTYEESETAPTAVGKYTLIASTAATENYLAATVEVDFEISQGKVDLTVVFENESEGTVSATFDGEANPVVYTAPQGVTLKVEYEGTDGTTYEKSETAPTNAGSYTVKLTYAGDDRFNAYEKTLKFVIGKAANTLEVTVETILEGGELAPVVVENNAGEVTYRYKGRGDTTYEESATAPTAAGTYTLIASAATNGNYLASETEVEFEILSEDPLFGLDADIREQVKNKVLLNDMRLAGQSYETNTDVSRSLNGIVTSKNTHLMLLSDQLDADSYSLVIKSNKSFLAYFYFAIEGGDTYDTVRNHDADYVAKQARDVQILTGTNVITFSLKDAAQAGKPIKGVYIDLYQGMAGSELTVYGFYKSRVITDAEVPTELKEQVKDKVALSYTLSAANWETNTNIEKFGDKILVVDKENLSLLSANMPSKIYLLVKSDTACEFDFRFAIDEAVTYDLVVNQPEKYCKYMNTVQVAKGYQILTIDMTAYEKYAGETWKPVTGFHALMKPKTANVVLFGIWADEEPKEPEIPEQPTDEEILAGLQQQVANKTKLNITLSAPSWDTNGNQTKQNDDGSITVDNSCLSLDIDGIQPKIYLLVKSDAITTGAFRFAIGGNHGYDPVATDPNNHCKYFNEETIQKGFSLLEINLSAYSGYKGDEAAELTGVHVIWSQKTTLTIYGIYVDTATNPDV